jgi:hypothetical protein
MLDVCKGRSVCSVLQFQSQPLFANVYLHYVFEVMAPGFPTCYDDNHLTYPIANPDQRVPAKTALDWVKKITACGTP